MAKDRRVRRRIVGVFSARLPELGLKGLPEHRKARGRRWKKLSTLVKGPLVGLMAGCTSFREVECLTAEMSLPMRRQLGIPRRMPDTTMRTTMCHLPPDDLRACLRRQARAAYRRKALAPVGLPFGHVAIDGKHTAIDAWDDFYAQRQTHSVGLGASGVVRTMTVSLVSSRPKICLDASPIPASTNEMGHLPQVLAELFADYGSLELFRLISYDAGACSEANARLIVETYKKDYLFRLNAEQPTLYRDAKRLLGRRPADQADAVTVDIRGRVEVPRRLYLTSELAGYLDWTHLKTVARIQVEKRDIETGQLIEQKDDEKERYYLSSLAQETLSPEQWLLLIRRHWAVENENHNTLDTVFLEDDHPWFTSGEEAPQGAVVMMLLRRIAYNMLALFRSVTQRSEEKRQTPWKDVLRWVQSTLIAATEHDCEGLRQRAESVA
jgi:hypothetical protein